jgi:hypothetical protein
VCREARFPFYRPSVIPSATSASAGVGISDLGAPDPAQRDLFEDAVTRPAISERQRRLAAALDRIEARFGAGALCRGLNARGPESEGF